MLGQIVPAPPSTRRIRAPGLTKAQPPNRPGCGPLPGHGDGDVDMQPASRRGREVYGRSCRVDQERFVDVFDGVRLLTDADRHRRQADRPTVELAAHRREDCTVDLVEPEIVDAEQGESLASDVVGDRAVVPHLGEIAYAAQQAVGDTRRAARPAGDLPGTVLVDRQSEDAGSTCDDRLQLVGLVVIQPSNQPETVAGVAR